VKTRNLIISLAAASLALGTGNLFADEDQPYHVTFSAGTVNLDNDRDMRNEDVFLRLGFGRFIGNNFSLDLEYDKYGGTLNDVNAIAPGATYDKWKMHSLGVMGRYHFGQSKFRPFVALGAGSQWHRSVRDEGSNLAINLGAGLRGQFSKHFSGTAEVLYRMDFDDSSTQLHNQFSDVIWNIGLSFDFGGKPPPPPPKKAPPPPPPPPNPDLDGDGVPNERDKCPNTRRGAVVDLDGCEVEAVIELDGVHFDFDKATLRPEAMAVLNDAAALLSKHERVVVEVAGHTDSKGSEDYNQGLSERRAAAVQDYLTSKGVKASRLSARGYGESRPVASNDTNEGRAENRRVELIVLDR
jgi:OOP family OmpA-OmpF porin